MSDQVDPNEPKTMQGWRAVAYARQKTIERLEGELRLATDTIKVCYADIHMHQGERLRNVQSVMNLQAEVESLKTELLELKGTGRAAETQAPPAPPVIPVPDVSGIEEDARRAQEAIDAELARKVQKEEEYAFKAAQARNVEAQRKAEAELKAAQVAKCRQGMAEARARENLRKSREAEQAAVEAQAVKARADAKKKFEAEEEARRLSDAVSQDKLRKKKSAEDEVARIQFLGIQKAEEARQERQAEEMRNAEERRLASCEKERLASAANRAVREQKAQAKLADRAEARRLQAIQAAEEKAKRKAEQEALKIQAIRDAEAKAVADAILKRNQASATLVACVRRIRETHIFDDLRQDVAILERMRAEEAASLKRMKAEEAASLKRKKAEVAAEALWRFKTACDAIFSTPPQDLFEYDVWDRDERDNHLESLQLMLRSDLGEAFVMEMVEPDMYRLVCTLKGAGTVISPSGSPVVIASWFDTPGLAEACLTFCPGLLGDYINAMERNAGIGALKRQAVLDLLQVIQDNQGLVTEIRVQQTTGVFDFTRLPKVSVRLCLDGETPTPVLITTAQFLEWFYRGYLHKYSPMRASRLDYESDS